MGVLLSTPNTKKAIITGLNKNLKFVVTSNARLARRYGRYPYC